MSNGYKLLLDDLNGTKLVCGNLSLFHVEVLIIVCFFAL